MHCSALMKTGLEVGEKLYPTLKVGQSLTKQNNVACFPFLRSPSHYILIKKACYVFGFLSVTNIVRNKRNPKCSNSRKITECIGHRNGRFTEMRSSHSIFFGCKSFFHVMKERI